MQVRYLEGLTALSAAITGVGYMEMRLLLRLINPLTVLPEHQFWTVAHVTLARLLEDKWLRFLTHLTTAYQSRYHLFKGKVQHQPVTWEKSGQDSLLRHGQAAIDLDASIGLCGVTPNSSPQLPMDDPFGYDLDDWELPLQPGPPGDEASSSSAAAGIDPDLEALLQTRAARRQKFEAAASTIRPKLRQNVKGKESAA